VWRFDFLTFKMQLDDMTFESRLRAPLTVGKTTVAFRGEDGMAMSADYAEPLTITPETPVEIWKCGCGGHTCASFIGNFGDGREVLVTANIPEDTAYQNAPGQGVRTDEF
jgi:20S proteasome alpha/beta subunit